MIPKKPGGMTIPGEAGYEALTLQLAEKWGADVIRDSDGTTLSDELLKAPYDIYSTICIIRGHNEWARSHPQCLQQTFLLTEPKLALGEELAIPLLEDYYHQQFKINDTPCSLRFWQVFDRTVNREHPRACWRYDANSGSVKIKKALPWHEYTVTFLVYRTWEEISMYNAVTNHLHGEHLVALEPFYPEVREYMRCWLEDWCKAHPNTDVIRFTSLFYNFVWLWGERAQNRFTDWASYDFAVSDKALEEFEKTYGCVSLEDFLHRGHRQTTHCPDHGIRGKWREFIHTFVTGFGRELTDIVHRYGKRAVMFYDDSWVGTEPCSASFAKIGMDGIVKCVFSGFEVRLCGCVEAKIHELRLHPYLFPTGVNGNPSFLEGGDPVGEARRYWMHIRRAMLRQKIDRIGLGGYLHLVLNKPEFSDYIAQLADEFRTIRALHEGGSPAVLPVRVAVVTAWGSLRPWTLCGHFHEAYKHDLIHINESLSGLPFDVSFLSFDDVCRGDLDGYDAVINAGMKDTAWSGGEYWRDGQLVEQMTRFVYEGGLYLGVNEPSCIDGEYRKMRMAHVLGVDLDEAMYASDGVVAAELSAASKILIPRGYELDMAGKVRIIDPATKVLAQRDGYLLSTCHDFGQGRGIYLSAFRYSEKASRLLLNLLLYGCKKPLIQEGLTDNPYVDCAYYPQNHAVAIVNNSNESQNTEFFIGEKNYRFALGPEEGRYFEL